MFTITKRPTACGIRWWAGRGNAILSEPASSHENCPKTRTPRSGSPTITPALACGASVALALARKSGARTLLGGRLLVPHWLTHLFEPDFAVAFDPVRTPLAWHVFFSRLLSRAFQQPAYAALPRKHRLPA